MRPSRGANAENLEVVAGDELAPDLTGAAASAQVDRGHDGAEELRERPIVIAEVLIVGIRDAQRTSGARFGEDDGELPDFVTPASGLSAMPLSIVKTAAFRPMPSVSTPTTVSEKAGFFASAADRVADVAHQIPQRLEPARGPHAAGRFGRQRDVAELLQRRIVRVRSIRAIGDLLLRGDRQVRADFFLEVVFVECNGPAALQPGQDPHGHSSVPGAWAPHRSVRSMSTSKVP